MRNINTVRLVRYVLLVTVAFVASFALTTAAHLGRDELEAQAAQGPPSVFAMRADAQMSQAQATRNYGAATSINVDGNEPAGTGRDTSSLLRFDLSAVPPGTKVASARLKLDVTNGTTDSYQLQPLRRAWVEGQAAWNVRRTGSYWGIGGARSSATDREATVMATVAPAQAAPYSVGLSAAGVAKVQGWIDNPSSNFGAVVSGATKANGFDFRSREVADPARKPTLELDYEVPPEETTAPTTAEPPPPPPPPDTAIQSWLDADSTAPVDEDGSGTETTRLTYTVANANEAEYSLNGGAWTAATASPASITVPANGQESTVELRAKRSSDGAVDSTPASSSITVCPQAGCATEPPPPDPGTAPAQGVFPGGQFGNPAWDTQMRALAEFEALVGHEQEAVLFFHAWASNTGPLGFPASGLRPYADAGKTPIVTWEMRNHQATGTEAKYNYDALLRGDHDAYVRSYANQVEAFGSEVYMRPFHEMNGKWYDWGDGVNGNTPAKSAEAFRYLDRIFAEEGATNAKFLWNPNVAGPVLPASAPLADFYPGDAAVDLIGLDGYNWGDARSMPWYSPEQVFGNSYGQVAALPSSDPIAIIETATHPTPGDKAAWIDDLRTTVPEKFPRIDLVMWFQSNQEGALWRTDTSQTSSDAYRRLTEAFAGIF
jgi:hypothetical protein